MPGTSCTASPSRRSRACRSASRSAPASSTAPTESTSEHVIAEADSAMYQAKQEGGGRYHRSSEDADEAAPAELSEPAGQATVTELQPVDPPKRLLSESEAYVQTGESAPEPPAPPAEGDPAPVTQLRPAQGPREHASTMRELITEAIHNDGLLLYAQPVIDLRNGETAHHELLVRMRGEAARSSSPRSSSGSPPRTRGCARRSISGSCAAALRGLTTGRMSGACRSTSRARRSPTQPRDGTDRAGDHRVGIATGSLAFEVAEEAIDRDVDAAVESLNRLAETGAPIVLDGFSAGFGSARVPAAAAAGADQDRRLGRPRVAERRQRSRDAAGDRQAGAGDASARPSPSWSSPMPCCRCCGCTGSTWRRASTSASPSPFG